MRDGPADPDPTFLAFEEEDRLNHRQKVLFTDIWEQFVEFLHCQGKDPDRSKGYKQSSVRPLARRTFQVFDYYWDRGEAKLEITPKQADQFLRRIDTGEIETTDGGEYSESSKQKFSDALETYFRFVGEEWEPKISFSDTDQELGSDPFTKRERELLFATSLEYRSPPNYKNLSPEERDRWKSHLAQDLGKPKDSVGPDDWTKLQQSWKVPSLISAAFDLGARAALVNRLTVDLLNLEEEHVVIPREVAVKNDQRWISELSKRTVTLLRRWLQQRENISKYDDSEKVWLNRKGNPHTSATLNTLLDNLIAEAEIDQRDRKLSWHSIRHTTGMYIYNEVKDLEAVAEILRQKSLEAAKRYAHPTPETKKDIIESIQGGDSF